MSALSRAFILTAVALCFVTQARADDTPADTASFVSYCTDDNFEACRLEVVDVNNQALITQLFNKSGCTFPVKAPSTTKTDSIPATKTILAWLRANGATRAPKTRDAIAQATKALWPESCVH